MFNKKLLILSVVLCIFLIPVTYALQPSDVISIEKVKHINKYCDGYSDINGNCIGSEIEEITETMDKTCIGLPIPDKFYVGSENDMAYNDYKYCTSKIRLKNVGDYNNLYANIVHEGSTNDPESLRLFQAWTITEEREETVMTTCQEYFWLIPIGEPYPCAEKENITLNVCAEFSDETGECLSYEDRIIEVDKKIIVPYQVDIWHEISDKKEFAQNLDRDKDVLLVVEKENPQDTIEWGIGAVVDFTDYYIDPFFNGTLGSSASISMLSDDKKYFLDNFEDYSNSSISSTNWTIDNGNWIFTNTSYNHYLKNNSTATEELINLSNHEFGNYSITFAYNLVQDRGADIGKIWFGYKHPLSSSERQAYIVSFDDDDDTVHVGKWVSGSFSYLTGSPNTVTINTNTWYWIKINVNQEGATKRIEVYHSSDGLTWTTLVNTTDSSYTGNHKIGFSNLESALLIDNVVIQEYNKGQSSDQEEGYVWTTDNMTVSWLYSDASGLPKGDEAVIVIDKSFNNLVEYLPMDGHPHFLTKASNDGLDAPDIFDGAIAPESECIKGTCLKLTNTTEFSTTTTTGGALSSFNDVYGWSGWAKISELNDAGSKENVIYVDGQTLYYLGDDDNITFSNTNGIITCDASGLTMTDWNHFAVSNEEGGDFHLWANGVEMTCNDTAGIDLRTGDLSMYVGSTVSGYSLNGWADEFIWFNNTLNQTQVDSLYALEQPYIKRTPQALAYYPLDINAEDGTLVSTKNDLTINGTTLSSFSKYGTGSYYFDGNDNMYKTSAGITLTNNVSICVWIYPTAISNFDYLITTDDTAQRISLLNDNTGKYRFEITGFTPSSTINAGTSTINSWSYLCGVYNSTHLSLYQDSIFKGSSLSSGSLNILNRNWFLGSHPSGTQLYYRGYIDELKIFDRALTQEEITYLYTRDFKLLSSETQQEQNFKAMVISSNINGFSGATKEGWGVSADPYVMNRLPTVPTSLPFDVSAGTRLNTGETINWTASGSTDEDGDSITYYYRLENINDSSELVAWDTSDTDYITLDTDNQDYLTIYAGAWDGYNFSASNLTNTTQNRILFDVYELSQEADVTAISSQNYSSKITYDPDEVCYLKPSFYYNGTNELSYKNISGEIQYTNPDSLNATYPDGLFNSSVAWMDNTNTTYTYEMEVPYFESDPENVTLYWNVYYSDYNSTGSCQLEGVGDTNETEIAYQNVYFPLGNCSDPQNETAMILWLTDEDTTNTTIFGDIYATIRVINGDIDGNYTYSAINSTNLTVCLYPDTELVFDSNIEYSSAENSYVVESYYHYHDSLGTVVLTSYLRDLADNRSTTYRIHVEDTDFTDLKDSLVYLERYYPDEDVYKVVEIGKTDDFGFTLFHLIDEDVFYKFKVQEANEVVYSGTPFKASGCASEPCSYEISLARGTYTVPYDYLADLPDFNYNITFNDTTDVYRLDYIDTSGETLQNVELKVYTDNFGRQQVSLCNSSSSDISGALICNISGTEGVVKAEAYVTREGELVQLKTDDFEILQPVFNFGLEGLLFATIILILTGLISLYSPSVSVIVLVFSTVSMQLLHLIFLPWSGIIAIVIIGSVIAYAIGNKENA